MAKCHRPVYRRSSRLGLADEDQKKEGKASGRSARSITCSSTKDAMRLLYLPRAYGRV